MKRYGCCFVIEALLRPLSISRFERPYRTRSRSSRTGERGKPCDRQGVLFKRGATAAQPAVETHAGPAYTPSVPVALRLILVLAVAALFAATALSFVMAYLLLRPPRMSDGKALWLLKRLSPEDLGLSFENVEFRVQDEGGGRPLRLAGWWIPHPHAQSRCVVLVHGYADAKVGVIAWAPVFHSLGCNIFAIDMRAHGESGGTISTAGFYEWYDLDQVINELRAQRPGETKRLTLFGVSTGAAIVSAVATRRDDLAGIILDSPFADFRHAAMAHFDLLGLPGRPVQRLALRLAERMSGADFGAISPRATLGAVRCPVMLIQCEADPFTDTQDQAALRAVVDGRSNELDVYWRVEGCAHLMAVCADEEQYRQRVGDFLASTTVAATEVRS